MVGYIADVAFYKVPDPPHVSRPQIRMEITNLYLKAHILDTTDYRS